MTVSTQSVLKAMHTLACRGNMIVIIIKYLYTYLQSDEFPTQVSVFLTKRDVFR